MGEKSQQQAGPRTRLQLEGFRATAVSPSQKGLDF